MMLPFAPKDHVATSQEPLFRTGAVVLVIGVLPAAHRAGVRVGVVRRLGRALSAVAIVAALIGTFMLGGDAWFEAFAAPRLADSAPTALDAARRAAKPNRTPPTANSSPWASEHSASGCFARRSCGRRRRSGASPGPPHYIDSMIDAVVTLAERPDLVEAMWTMPNTWPPFMLEDPVADLWFGRLPEVFGEYQLLALDAAGGVVGKVNSVPFAWSGRDDALPARGWDGILERAFAGQARDVSPTAVSLLEARVVPALRGGGLSARLLEAAVANTRRLG